MPTRLTLLPPAQAIQKHYRAALDYALRALQLRIQDDPVRWNRSSGPERASASRSAAAAHSAYALLYDPATRHQPSAHLDLAQHSRAINDPTLNHFLLHLSRLTQLLFEPLDHNDVVACWLRATLHFSPTGGPLESLYLSQKWQQHMRALAQEYPELACIDQGSHTFLRTEAFPPPQAIVVDQLLKEGWPSARFAPDQGVLAITRLVTAKRAGASMAALYPTRQHSS